MAQMRWEKGATLQNVCIVKQIESRENVFTERSESVKTYSNLCLEKEIEKLFFK